MKFFFPEIPIEILKANMRKQIYWITQCIAQGAYPEENQLYLLANEGITHIFNVGTAPLDEKQKGLELFTEILWQPFPDLVRIKDEIAIFCLDAMHRMLSLNNSKIYIHCVAGQNRSATILWLYFIACGLKPYVAEEIISRATLDAIPGHPMLIDKQLIRLARKHGEHQFFPISRPEILLPVGID